MKNEMTIIKSPFRLSLFGGSSDYKEFYEKHGSLIIGTTINKYNYICIRTRPNIMSKKSVITYSKLEEVISFDEITNPLIKETLKYFSPNWHVELNSFTDIPGRTGLGGSSSYCVGLCYVLRKILNLPSNKKLIANDAIKIEREILKEYGGIQDQIWASYGGTNSIQINKDGDFFVKPLPITDDFKTQLEESMILIYSNEQRCSDDIALSHKNKDKSNILSIAKEAYQSFIIEDIKNIGSLLYSSWLEKKNISPIISNNNIDNIINTCMSLGSYGAKLLGSGGCGFVLVICNKNTKTKIEEVYKNNIMEFNFEKEGVSKIL